MIGDWIGIAGPTASGKTALALAVARQLPVEIISVDSALIYRGMDVGTAKPTPAELAAVPHHLIDILSPTEAYSAARFVSDARQLITEIHARQRMPLLVGGTMLYFRALMQGIDELPPADPNTRAALDAEARARGWPAMHGELARVDPAAAARLAPNDAQRIQRALEVWRLTGKPLSDHFGQAGAQTACPPRHLIALEPQDRAWLHTRIAQRFDTMLAQGLVDEVRALRARGDLHLGLPSMRCVGYRQAWEALDETGGAALGAPQLARLRERGIAATRQLAKRQLTWLRSMPKRTSVTPERIDAQQVIEALTRVKSEGARRD